MHPSSQDPFPPVDQSVPARSSSSGRGVLVALAVVTGTVLVAAVAVLVLIISGISTALPSIASGGPGDPGTTGESGGAADRSAEPKAGPKYKTEDEPQDEPKRITPPKPSPPPEEARFDAETPGWYGVAVRKHGVAYDVPKTWAVQSPTLMIGFEQEDPDAPFGYSPTASMEGVSTYAERSAACRKSSPPKPAAVGVDSVGDGADPVDPVKVAEKWAGAAYADDVGVSLDPGESRGFTAHGIEGIQATVKVRMAKRDCYPTEAEVRAVSFSAHDGTGVRSLIIYADTSGPLAPDPADIDTIIASLRPLDPAGGRDFG